MPLTPEQNRLWKADMNARLDALAHEARMSRQLIELQDAPRLADTTAINERWRAITALFPDDFEPRRAGDLARHLHFAQAHDFSDVELLDIPALREAVNGYQVDAEQRILAGQNELPANVPAIDLIHPTIREATIAMFNNRQYDLCARTAVEALFDEVRRYSGFADDGARLVNAAFGTQAGQMSFSNCENQTEQSVTNGFKDILLGTFKGIRNPLSHGWTGFSRIEALQIMVLCSLIFSRIQRVPNE